MKKPKGGTIAVSWGGYGGFNYSRKYVTRLCLGWVAIYYFPEDLDESLVRYLDSEEGKL